MQTFKFNLPKSWKTQLSRECNKPYMESLKAFLDNEDKANKTIYPPAKDYFRALDLTDFANVKIVIIGQDPYHGPNQAHGLSFSVRPNIKIPPSLRNIYKELKSDLGITQPEHGCLESWAKQGVLLLNAVLSVEKSSPGSHQNKGWERLTDAIIESLNSRENPMVFMLWGAYAQRKADFIDRSKHLVLESSHPSPFSAHKGFLGSKPFSKANDFLKKSGSKPIDWQLPVLPLHLN